MIVRTQIPMLMSRPMSINAISEQIKAGTALARECEVCILPSMSHVIFQAADDVDDTPVMHLSPRQILCEKITTASHTSLMR